jgi:hypothetical protein
MSSQVSYKKVTISCIMLYFTFFRIVVLSPSLISSVLVTVDGKTLGEATHSDGPLYTLAWNPQLYHIGLHTITVKVQVHNVMDLSL